MTAADDPRLGSGLAQALEHESTVPLWEVFDELISRAPSPAAQPHLWSYGTLRPLLMEAGAVVSVAEAERRVMLLRNPALDRPTVAKTLVAGVQLVLPGEHAPPHRHSQAALRFVLESSGGMTTVGGRDWPMEPGDLVLNPSWAWHSHSNPGSSPLVWLDGLDLPLANFLGVTFADGPSEALHGERAGEGRAEVEASGLPCPGDGAFGRSTASQQQRHSYRDAHAALRELAAHGPLDPYQGFRIEYRDTVSGSSVLPTLSAFLQELPAGFRGLPLRSTASSVYAVVEGSGTTHVGRSHLSWRPRDVFVVPGWLPHLHDAAEDAVLFSFSDQAALQRLDLWIEQRLEGRAALEAGA